MNKTLRYTLPNLVTCIGMILGLVAVALATRGQYEMSAWFIVLCVLIDKLDGTVARLVKGSSEFGVQMDSFSDLITFGVAPGFLVLSVMTAPAGRLDQLDAGVGYHLAVHVGVFFFVAAAALRLAKFNVLTDIYGKTHFFGLPTTMCGALISTYFLTVRKYGLNPIFIDVLPFGLIGLGLLMVSRLPLPKLTSQHSKVFNVFQFANIGAVYICGFLWRLPEYLFGISLAYVFIGGLTAYCQGVRPPRPGAPGSDVGHDHPVVTG